MTKVVINTCFGGYGLSDEAIQRYAALKGITLYPKVQDNYWRFVTYWTVPAEERLTDLEDHNEFYKMSIEKRIAHNERYEVETFDINEVPRDDAVLVQVVEELGSKAYGDHAELTVVEIPDDVKWYIEEYDGSEHVAEVHRTWRE